MRRAAPAPLLLCLAPLLLAAPVRAEEPAPVTARLIYQQAPGVSGCPGEDRLRQEVRVRLGYDPFEPGAGSSPPTGASPGKPAAPSDLAVQVSIEPRGDTLLGKIVYLDPAGRPTDQRELWVPSSPCACWSLVTYLSVAIAFALSPFPLPEAKPPAPPPCPEPRPCPPALPCPIAQQPRPAPRAGRGPEPAARPEIQVGAGWLIGLGLGLPATPTGGFGQVRLRWPVVSVALEGRAQAPALTEGLNGAPAEVGLYAGAAASCVHEGLVFACLSGALGALHVRGPTVNDAFTFMAVGLRGGLELPLGERLLLQLRAEIFGTVTPTRTPIDAKSPDEWLAGPLSGSAGAGVLARF